MFAGSVWLNRERLVFLITAVALAATGAFFLESRPGFRPAGEHLVERRLPRKLNFDPADFAKPKEIDTRGPRANPFSRYVDQSVMVPVGPGPLPPPIKPPPPPKPPKPPKPPDTAPAPKPYQVPVDFRGILAADSGELFVLLKVKQTGENRRLVEGDIWPETGLRIVKITTVSVLLENDKGERYLMRDLYTRKGTPEADADSTKH